MTTVEDIERAIEKLGAKDFDKLRAWFEDLQAARFDAQIVRDAAAGKLDALADQAIAAHRKGLTRDL